MYCSYFLIQSIVVLLIPTAIALAALEEWIPAVAVLTVALLTRTKAFQVRLRTGRWRARAPFKTATMVKKLQEEYTPLGRGWGIYLKREIPTGKCVHTYNFTGTYSNKDGTFWKCGTTIGRIAKHYKSKGKAFHSMPSWENISLGAWVTQHNHGSGGDIGKPSNECFYKVHFIDTDNIERVEYYDTELDIKYLIGMSFRDLAKNKEYTKVRVDDIKEWLKKDAFQRVMFLHGEKAIGVRWEKRHPGESMIHNACICGKRHKDPHCCSRFCLWFQTDIYCCPEPDENYLADVHLYNINRFVPRILPFMPILACMRRNFELKVMCNKEGVLRIFNELQEVAKDARLELRFSEDELWIDVSVVSSKVDQVYKQLKKIVPKFELHKGKYIPSIYTRNPTFEKLKF